MKFDTFAPPDNAAQNQEELSPVRSGSAFTQGIRGGMEDVAAQTHGLLGQAAEVIGADAFAAEQRAKAVANQQEAERLTANIPTFDKVHGIRDAWNYGTGLLGRSLPVMGAGIAGATLAPGAGPLAAIAGMTAATAPSTIGAQFNAQQNDPAQARRGVLDRTLTGVGAGTAEAAAMSVVPQAVGGKLFAKAAEGAAEKVAMPFGKAALHNIPEAVLGNAAAGNVSARIGQEAASHLNPNRDTSNDAAEQNDAMIGGAVMGAPFAAAGIAGAMRGKKAGGPVAEPLPKSTKAEKTEGVPVKTFAEKVSDLGSPLKADPTTAEEHVQAAGGITLDDTPETMAAKDAQGAGEATAKSQRTLDKLMADPTAAAFHDELSKIDPSTSAGQTQIRDANIKHFEAKQTEASLKQADTDLDAFMANGDGASSFSKDTSGADAGIYKMMDTPEWQYLGDDAKNQAVTLTRKLIVAGEQGGVLPPTAMRAAVELFGKDTVSRLSKIYDAMGSKDPAKVESFYKAMTKLSEVQKNDDSLLTIVRNALPEHLIDSVRTPQLKEFVKQMQDLTGERMFKGMTPSEQAVKKQQINAKLQEVFGENADKVNEAFAKHAAGEEKLLGVTPPDRTDTAKANAREVNDENDFSYSRESADPLEASQDTEVTYYGSGKKGDGFVEHQKIARTNYPDSESAHERLARTAQEEHPTADVSWVSAKEYAKKNGITPEQLNEMTKGRPDDYGMIAAEKMADRDAFGWKDLDAMRISTKKSSHYDSPSRIDTGTAEHPGPILDAMAIASHMMKKLPRSDVDEQGGMHRLARAFKEGIAAISDHMTEALHVPDETVVARRGGKDVTWGDLQKVRNDTAKGEADVDQPGISQLKRRLNTIEVKQAKLEQSGLDPEVRRRQHNGEPLTAEEFRDFKSAREEWKRLQEQKNKLEDDISYREHKDDITRLKDEISKSDLTADDNIHLTAAGSKPEEMQRKVGVDGQHLGTDIQGKSVVPKGHLNEGSVTDLGRRALGNRISAYENSKSVVARALGKKARVLLDHFDDLTMAHQSDLAKIIKYENPGSAAATINGLTERYAGKFMTKAEYKAELSQQKWASTVANEGGAQHAATLAGIARRSDPRSLQHMLDVLNTDKKPNEFKQGVIDAVNTRIADLIAKNPDEGYGLLIRGNEEPKGWTDNGKLRGEDDEVLAKAAKDARAKRRGEEPAESRVKPGATESTPDQQRAIVDHINKVTGDSVDVNTAARTLGFSGSFTEGKTDAAGIDHRPAISVSVWAMDPTSVGYHESLHWFADHLRQHGDPKVFGALTKAADSPYVRNFLRNALKDQPEALKQIEGSAEERVAYMYQYHAAGSLKLGERGKTIMDHIGDYIKKVMGVWSNDKRAEHIMDYFHSGDYAKGMAAGAGERSPAYQHMMEQGRNKTLDYLHKAAAPLTNLMDSVAGIGSARIQDMGIPALSKIVDMVRLHGTKEGSDAGYLPAAGAAMRGFSNKMVNRMGEFNFEEANEAFAAIALGKAPKDAAQTRIMNGMRDTLDEMHGYLKDAGVDIGDRGVGKNYLPRQWDSAYVVGHQAEFRAMIEKYVASGEFKGSADELMSRLMRDEGSEMESADAMAKPGDQYAKKRELHFITAEDAAPFLEKNAMRVLTSYIKQGTRRAEWSRRFEMKPVNKELSPLDEMRAAAVKQGATPDQMALVEKYLAGVTGQLGTDVRPETRKLFGQIMVYQNLRLLPMGFFSSLIDPVGVAVRGGTAKDVFNNFKRGILEIPRGFEKNPKYDEGYHLAEDMGVIDNAVLQHVMGASYGLNAVGNKARLVNETLFKWNLMEQMNTSQRVAATEAAMGFLKKHGSGDFNQHSMRYLGELGLKPSDIKLVDGRVAVRAEDFVKSGMNAKASLEAHLKMRQAVNSWVDGAVLRPDQSQKAIWMNDAHYSLIAHMKQFAFSFQDTILKRVIAEAQHGNYAPATAMAGYIPVMLTADLVKGMIQGGGSQPAWKQDWDVEDYLSTAVQRAGLLGVGQFGVDALKDLHRGGVGIGALGGPTLGQLGEVASTVGGSRGFEATVLDSMPANALWSGYLPQSVTHPTAGGFAPTELNTVD